MSVAGPLLAVPGAVAAPAPDGEVPWHYGDPVAEQRRLLAGTAVVDLGRDVLTVSGPDRLSWLHSLTTQALDRLAPGVAAEALVLTPHGHVEHALHLVDDGERVWVTTDPGAGAALAAWLDRMRFLLRVEVAEVGADWVVLGTCLAPDAPADRLLAALGITGELPPAWQDPWPALGEGSASYAAVEAGEHPGWQRPWRELLVPREVLAAAVPGVATERWAGTWAAEALRVAAWRPRAALDVDHRTLPHELDWLRTAVHLEKGCYRGQETVARVFNLGHPPRRLTLLHLDGSEHVLPPPGSAVWLEGRQVGTLASTVRHHELGPTAFALLKRSTPVDRELSVSVEDGAPGTLPAAQEPVVDPARGRSSG